MPQSLSRILIHTIFSTKNREPFLRVSGVRTSMHGELGGIAKKLECNPIMIGGVEDHVHLLTTLSRTCKPAEFVKEVKRASSIWIKEEFEGYGRFQWQSGYGCFSIGQSQVEEICDYIANQEEHHKRVSFQDEFRTFLRQHEIEYDERYVWD